MQLALFPALGVPSDTATALEVRVLAYEFWGTKAVSSSAMKAWEMSPVNVHLLWAKETFILSIH